MPVKQLSDGNPDGTVLGQSATDLISFYNATPVAQQASTGFPALTDNTGGTAAATFAAITAGGAYAQADMVAVKNALAQVVLNFNGIRTMLRTLGLSA